MVLAMELLVLWGRTGGGEAESWLELPGGDEPGGEDPGGGSPGCR